MDKPSHWVIRSMKCPGEDRTVDLLVEWKVEKGKKILQSVSCNDPGLVAYSGKDCEWLCLGKISGRER